jgi:fatty acid synthase
VAEELTWSPKKRTHSACHDTRRYLISQHPEVEAKLAAELDGAGLLVTPQRPQPRPLAHADLARLTYLNCVLKARARA